VLHAFNVSVDRIFIDLKEFEEAGQGLVAVNDGAGDACAFLGEGGATVFDMGDKAFGIKLLEHVGNTGLRDLQTFRNVDGAGVALFLNEVEDLLEVVIAGGRAAGTVTGAGSIGHGSRRLESAGGVKEQEAAVGKPLRGSSWFLVPRS